jgi:copper homeostasis protein
MQFEICIESAEGALAAQEGGAQRVELCADLMEGGLTPSLGTIQLAREIAPHIGINVIIRPRGGDFLYSEVEYRIMAHDIEAAKQAGANGVVIGLLRSDGTIDLERTRRLVELARPMSVTFHRAFDMCRDPFEALEQLVGLGVNRILTSGQKPTVPEGLELIARLVKKADKRIIIMPGGGIDESNLRQVVTQSGAPEFHFVASELQLSPMLFRNPDCFMGDGTMDAEYQINVTTARQVRKMIAAAY